jgi:hypothetical protein
MALNDITVFDDGTYIPGSKRYAVKAGRNSAIKAGDFVLKSLGNTAGYVATAWTPGGAASTAKPVVATDVMLGLATSTSTETTSAAGVVDVMPIVPGVTYLCAPTVAATWDTQTEYDALVGARVLLNYAATTNVFTVLASDSATSALIVEPLDVTLHPGKVRFSLRQGVSYAA